MKKHMNNCSENIITPSIKRRSITEFKTYSSSAKNSRNNSTLKQLSRRGILPPLHPNSSSKRQSETEKKVQIKDKCRQNLQHYHTQQPISSFEIEDQVNLNTQTASFGFYLSQESTSPNSCPNRSHKVEESKEKTIFTRINTDSLILTFGRKNQGQDKCKVQGIIQTPKTIQKAKILVEISNTGQKGRRKLYYSKKDDNNNEEERKENFKKNQRAIKQKQFKIKTIQRKTKCFSEYEEGFPQTNKENIFNRVFRLKKVKDVTFPRLSHFPSKQQ